MRSKHFCDVEKGETFIYKGRNYTKIDKTTGVTVRQHVKYFEDNQDVEISENY